MGLIHWWPLNGNTKDQGVNNLSLSTSGITWISSGKIGQEGKFTTSHGAATAAEINYSQKSISFGGWFKFNKAEIQTVLTPSIVTSTATTPTGNLIGNDRYGGIGLIWNSNNIYSSGSFSSMTVFAALRNPDNTNYITTTQSITFDTWYHFMLVWNLANLTLYFYVNGALKGSRTLTAAPTFTSNSFCINYNAIYGGNGPGRSIPMHINDVRIYDHALSLKEIKEISKGLVLHYNFEDTEIEATTNLGGTSATYSNQTKGYAYSANSWGGDAGTCTYYSSGGYQNYPYKVYHKTATGNGGIYRKTSDTIVIEAGKTYTMSVYVKASRNINSASAYSFNINRGSDNNYINYGESFNITTEWKRLTKTFTASSSQAGTYGEMSIIYDDGATDYYVYYSGFQIEQKDHATPFTLNTRSAGIVYDVSGYGYNSTATNNITITSGSASGTYCANFNSSNSSYVKISPMAFLTNALTVNIWAYKSDWGGSNVEKLISCTESGGWQFILSGSNTLSFSFMVGSSYNFIDTSRSDISAGWHMITATYDGVTAALYIDGVLKSSGSVAGIITYNSTTPVIIGAEPNSNVSIAGDYFTGKIGDVKIYSTALTQDQITSEYQRKAAIDKSGILYGGELYEYSTTPNLLFNANARAAGCTEYGGARYFAIKESAYLPNSNSGGFGYYTQSNLTLSATSQGFRIYSPPNIQYSSQNQTMWGGLILEPMKVSNCLYTGHRYIITWHIEGQSSRAMECYWSNQVGWGQSPDASPTVNSKKIQGANFNGSMDCEYDFTINDNIFKTTGSSVHSPFEANTSYLAYAEFKIGYNYADTGTLGTDIYITDIKMFDITDNKIYKITNTGVLKATEYTTGRRSSARLHSEGSMDITDIEET